MQNNAADKLSPFTKLTIEQQNLITQIISFTKQHINRNFPAVFTIYGEAGTGKSVVLSSCFTKYKNYVMIKLVVFIKLTIIFLLIIQRF